jgi:hypothetical protein
MSTVMNTLNITAWQLAAGYGHLLAGNIPTPVGVQPPGTQGLTTILSWIAWAVTFLCVVGVFFVAGSMAFAHRRGEGSEAIGKLGWVMGACILGASATSLVNVLI